jgi:hypothetical protein
MEKISIRQGSAAWVATSATFLLLSCLPYPAHAEIIEVRLEIQGGWLTTCSIPCYDENYRTLRGPYWVTFAYDTDLAGPDLYPLDPGFGEYHVPFIGFSVRLDGEMPFSFSCGLVLGKMTETPCAGSTGGGMTLGIYDRSMAIDTSRALVDTLFVDLDAGSGDKYFRMEHDQRWQTYAGDESFLNGDSITQLPLPRPNMSISFGNASLIHFGYERTRWFEDESTGSNKNSVTRDAGSPGLTLSKSLVAGCKGVIGRVTLSAPAPVGGTVVTVSDTLASTKTPATVKIREGATSNYFTISTTPVAAHQDGMVTVSLESKSSDQPLTVRPIGVSAVALNPTTVVGGHDSTGTATLECLAGPGPVTVDLSSSNAAVASPVATTVVIPQGLKSQPFTVATSPVLSKSSAMVTVEASTTTKSRRLNVVPAAAVSPMRLAFGSVSVGQTSGAIVATLRNDGAAPFAVSSINLTGTYASWFAQANNCPASLASGASCAISVTFAPAAAASKSAKLSIATSATATPLSVSLSGTGVLPL